MITPFLYLLRFFEVEKGLNHHIKAIIPHKITTTPIMDPMIAPIGNVFFSIKEVGEIYRCLQNNQEFGAFYNDLLDMLKPKPRYKVTSNQIWIND